MRKITNQASEYLQKEMEAKTEFVDRSLKDMKKMVKVGELENLSNAALVLAQTFHAFHQMLGAMQVVDRCNMPDKPNKKSTNKKSTNKHA